MKLLFRPLIAGLCLGLLATCVSAEELPRGLVKEKPAQTPFVKTEDGLYMVPYTMNIPGTEVPFTMIPIPGGSFKMGSPVGEADRRPDEGPQVEVTVEPFWMGKTEITWAQYWTYMDMYPIFKKFQIEKIRIVDETNRVDAVTAPTELYEPDTTYEYGDEPNMPAVTMTQYAAKQYTKWLSGLTRNQYRLPSEAEWEYAARAGTTTAYSFGDDVSQLGEYAWYYENSEESLHAVGQKKPNPWGLYDMHGSVAEWVLDAYTADGYGHLAAKQNLTVADTLNWPKTEFPRVVRGGSWDSDADRCRSAARMGSHDIDWKANDPNVPLSPWWFTDDPARGVGFRLLRPLKEMPRDKMEPYWEIDNDAVRWAVENRLEEGRGVLGLTDDKLPEAMLKLKEAK